MASYLFFSRPDLVKAKGGDGYLTMKMIRTSFQKKQREQVSPNKSATCLTSIRTIVFAISPSFSIVSFNSLRHDTSLVLRCSDLCGLGIFLGSNGNSTITFVSS